MSEFLFLYRSCEPARAPEIRQQMIQKWHVWLNGLREAGHVKDVGHPLAASGKLVRGRHKVTDGPFTEAKELVGGYTVIEARDLDHAAELSMNCPILEAGGAVEVRPILEVPAVRGNFP
jgi:hypothetical protein